jgi:Fe-S oxidoreductase
MCPSYRATKDERHLTRGRANTLRLAVSGQLGPEALTSDEVFDTLDLCVSCKGCRRECPTGVDMAKMKVEFLYQYRKRRGLALKDRLIAYLPRYALWAAWVAPVTNALIAIGRRFVGFAPQRALPKWRSDWFKGVAPHPLPCWGEGEAAPHPDPLPNRGEGDRLVDHRTVAVRAPDEGADPPLSPTGERDEVRGGRVPTDERIAASGDPGFSPTANTHAATSDLSLSPAGERVGVRGSRAPTDERIAASGDADFSQTANMNAATSDLSLSPAGERVGVRGSRSPTDDGVGVRGSLASTDDTVEVNGSLTLSPTREKFEGKEVVLFIDTFNRYFEPENARAAVAVLQAAGYAVHTPPPTHGSRPLCCGRTFLSCGLVDEAKREARRMLDAFKPYVDRGIAVVGLEPSCLFSLRDEFLYMHPDGEMAELALHAYLFEEFVAREIDAGRFALDLKPIAQKKALLHGHCHQKAFGAMGAAERVLKLVPELTVHTVASSCCGMAGSFGYDANHYDVSMRMGELSLLPAVREAGGDTLIVADGTSCRHQIADGAKRAAVHVARVLEEALRSA